MDSFITVVIFGIIYVLIGYLIRSNPNVIPSDISRHKKDVVSIEIAGRVGSIMIFGGLALAVLGIVLFAAGLYRGYLLVAAMATLLLFICISLAVYSSKRKYQIRSSGRIVASVLIFFFIAIPVSLFFLLRAPQITMTEDGISIEAVYGQHIERDAIEDVQLIPTMPHCLAVDEGFELLGVSRGEFVYEEWQNVYLYLQTPRSPYILIKTAEGRRYVLNFSRQEQTTECHKEISRYMKEYRNS